MLLTRLIPLSRQLVSAVSAAFVVVLSAVSVLIFTAGCGSPSAKTPVIPVASQSVPPRPAPTSALSAPAVPPDEKPAFRDVAQEAGLRYEWKAEGKRPLNILQTIGNGCAFLDYDNDGNLDILLVGPKLALYKGDGKGHFTDVTMETGLANLHGHFLGCAVGDYDNDGYNDVYISGYRTGVLLHNEGGKRFGDVTAQAGLKPQPWGTSCGWADLDGDGWLDLYVCNYVHFDPARDLVLCPFHGTMTGCGPNDYDAAQGILYHNQGSGFRVQGSGSKMTRANPKPRTLNPEPCIFRDVTGAWGIKGHGKGLGVAFADFDRSGQVSFAVANDLQPGDLFRRQNGKFRNIAAEAGAGMDETGQSHAGMGIDWGDYDNDGRLDLFVTTFRDEIKTLYHNDGYRMFNIVSGQAGIEQPALPYVGWGCKFFDADNDGWLDLMLANGHVQDNIDRFEKATYREPTLFLHNLRGSPTRFTDASRSAGLARLPAVVGRGLAVGDYDNDGKVDVLVVNSEGHPLLLHNETHTANGWISFRLEGNGRSNRDAYGAIVTVRDGAGRRMRQCQPGGSYLSSSDARVHVGLGKETPASVTVQWPDGKAQTWTGLELNRAYTVREGEAPQ